VQQHDQEGEYEVLTGVKKLTFMGVFLLVKTFSKPCAFSCFLHHYAHDINSNNEVQASFQS